MKQNTNTDLWKDFENDEDKSANPVTDGSQWVGQYDRRAKRREDAANPTTDIVPEPPISESSIQTSDLTKR